MWVRPCLRASALPRKCLRLNQTPLSRLNSSVSTSQTPKHTSGTKITGLALIASISVAGGFYAGYYLSNNSHAKQGIADNSSTVPLSKGPNVTFEKSEKATERAIGELTQLLGPDRIILDVNDRIAHSSTPWSAAPRGNLDRPDVIVCPRSTEEVSQIARICHRRRIPMIGFCGGTSLEGTLAATHGGVCIDFKLMNKVVALNKDDVDVVVQPGVGYVELNEMLAKEGLFFPPDPGPGAQIGGMISQGCSGTNAFRYGTVKDWVLGLTVVLADGTVIKTRGRPRKSSSGYNLTQLMVGSEGTLGLITEASLKLTSLPQNERVGVATFPSVHAAVATAVKVVQSGMPVGAMELLDETNMKAVNLGGYCDENYAEVPTLFFKFTGDTPHAADQQAARVQTLAQSTGLQSFKVSTTPQEAASLWQARKTILWSTLALKSDPSDGFLSSDTAVPIGRLADAIEASKQLAAASGLTCAFVGHVGDGNFHTAVLHPADQAAEARALIKAIQRKAIALDGTITGEHGVGIEYRDMVVEELGQDAVDAMRAVKLALDPLCLLNPGKLLRVEAEEVGGS